MGCCRKSTSHEHVTMFFFFNDTATTEIYTLSLHDALPISGKFESFDKYAAADTKNLEEEIKKIVESKPGLNPGAYMGLVMAKFKGKVDGKAAMEILNKFLK